MSISFIPMEVGIKYVSEDMREIQYRIEKIPGGLGYPLEAFIRACCYGNIPGIAPIAFELFDAHSNVEVHSKYITHISEIGANISSLKFKIENEPDIFYFGKVKKQIDDVLYARDFKIYNSSEQLIDVEILNPDTEILRVSSPQEVDLVVIFMCSIGFMESTDIFSSLNENSEYKRIMNKHYVDNSMKIRLNARFSPVENVYGNVKIDDPFKGFDTMDLRIRTNGTINPHIVMKAAMSLLGKTMSSLANISDIDWESVKQIDNREIEENRREDYTIEELKLTPKVYNEIKENYKVNSLRELVLRGDKNSKEVKEAIKKNLEEIGLKIEEFR